MSLESSRARRPACRTRHACADRGARPCRHVGRRQGATARSGSGSSTSGSTRSSTGCSPRTGGACCSSCRASTPRARTASIRRVFHGVNPTGVKVTSFRAPAGAELEHDYLWRIHAALPPRGDRSASSTAPTTRTSSRCGCTRSRRSRSGDPATSTSAPSSGCSSTRGRPCSRCSSTSRATSSGSGCRSGSTTRRSAGSSAATT